MTLIVTNATVVTMDGGGRVLSPGAVAIDGRDIVAVDTPSAIAAGYRAKDRSMPAAPWSCRA